MNKRFTEYNTGGTHEESPHGGIPIGIGANGAPNKVEQGETRYADYIYSNSVKPYSKEVLEKYGIDKKYEGKTYADISKSLMRYSKERPNDPLAIKYEQDIMQKLRASQEESKQLHEARRQEAMIIESLVSKGFNEDQIFELLQNPEALQQILAQDNVNMFDEGGTVTTDSPPDSVPEPGNHNWFASYTDDPDSPFISNTQNDATNAADLLTLGALGLSTAGSYLTGRPGYYTRKAKVREYKKGARLLERNLKQEDKSITSSHGWRTYPRNVIDQGRDHAVSMFLNSIFYPFWSQGTRLGTSYSFKRDKGGNPARGRAEKRFGIAKAKFLQKHSNSEEAKALVQTLEGNINRTQEFMSDTHKANATKRVRSNNYALGGDLTTYPALNLAPLKPIPILPGTSDPVAEAFYNLVPVPRSPHLKKIASSPLKFPQMPSMDPNIKESIDKTGAEIKAILDKSKGGTTPINAKSILPYLRYAPAVMSGISYLGDLFGNNQPSYQDAINIERMANTYERVPYTPSTSSLSPTYLDREYHANKLANQANATRSAILNSGAGNTGAIHSALLANGLNSSIGLGQLYRQADEYNESQRLNAFNVNNQIDMQNKQLLLQSIGANNQLLQSKIRDYMRTAQLRAQEARLASEARSNNLTNFANSLGGIGLETYRMNQLKSMYDRYSPSYTGHVEYNRKTNG